MFLGLPALKSRPTARPIDMSIETSTCLAASIFDRRPSHAASASRGRFAMRPIWSPPGAMLVRIREHGPIKPSGEGPWMNALLVSPTMAWRSQGWRFCKPGRFSAVQRHIDAERRVALLIQIARGCCKNYLNVGVLIGFSVIRLVAERVEIGLAKLVEQGGDEAGEKISDRQNECDDGFYAVRHGRNSRAGLRDLHAEGLRKKKSACHQPALIDAVAKAGSNLVAIKVA